MHGLNIGEVSPRSVNCVRISPSLISTWMVCRLVNYLSISPCTRVQLSLAILSWVVAVSTSKSWGVNRPIAQCRLSVVFVV